MRHIVASLRRFQHGYLSTIRHSNCVSKGQVFKVRVARRAMGGLPSQVVLVRTSFLNSSPFFLFDTFYHRVQILRRVGRTIHVFYSVVHNQGRVAYPHR